MTVIEVPLKTLDDEIRKLEEQADKRYSFVRDRINAQLVVLRWLRFGGAKPSDELR